MLIQSIMVLLTMLAADNSPNQNFELKCYPEKLQIGDTFYVQVIYHNKTDEEEILPAPRLRAQVLGGPDYVNAVLFIFFNHQGQKWSQALEKDFKFTFNATFLRETLTTVPS